MDKFLDFVGNVGNDLDRLAKILATALFTNHRFINLTGSEIIDLLHASGNKTLVMTQIEIGLRAIVGDKYLTMLKRTHRSGINVDVRI